jgi:hypothetical protein
MDKPIRLAGLNNFFNFLVIINIKGGTIEIVIDYPARIVGDKLPGIVFGMVIT